MYRSKKDVDKHVESLTSKLSGKEFQLRTYSIARLYYEVEDYASCQRYVEQYISEKSNNAAAYKLLGQALEKLGQKERALEQYKSSLDIDPTQSSLVLDICTILADKDVTFDPGRAKYWCEKAEATFPKHPVTFLLREKLIAMVNPDPEAIIQLLKHELAVRPKDVTLHARLLKHYSQTNRHKEAFEHSFEYEFDDNNFTNNYTWYETLEQILKYYMDNKTDWRYQLLLLTVKERLCALSLTEIPSGTSKGFVESNNLLHDYDQALNFVARSGSSLGCADFHAGLINHHRGQFVFHLATFLLRKAKKDLLTWREANTLVAPLLLIVWHTVPLDVKVNWLIHAPAKQQKAVSRWNLEGSYRSSQTGHYLLSNVHDKGHSFIDRVTQSCSDANWRDKIYEKVFTNIDQLSKKNNSDFVCNSYNNLVFRLPRKTEVQSYDVVAQRLYPNSLHHFVWMILNYKNYAHFECSIFDMLTPKSQNYLHCGPESLNKYDMFSFLLCTAFTAQQNRLSPTYGARDKPNVLPANITDLLCTLAQMKWWDCAYKLSQSELGTELTDIRSTLSRGLEVVRCIDNHSLDPELLCILGRTFNEKAKSSVILEEKTHLEMRAKLYYSNAIPLLERLRTKISLKFPVKRMFDYLHKDLSSQQITKLIEESKMFVSLSYLNENDYEKAIELLSGIKSAQAFCHLSQVYKKMALDMNDTCKENMSFDEKSKYLFFLNKAKFYANKSLETFKVFENDSQNDLHFDSQELLESIETHISKINNYMSNTNSNDVDARYLSDENVSSGGSEQMQMTLRSSNSHVFRNVSSTPKRRDVNSSTYRNVAESQTIESTKVDLKLLERIDLTVNNFMEQTKMWIEENRNLGNQIMNTVHANTQSTTDQIKLLKLSIDQIKEQIGECRDECKDVGELKRQVAELKKELIKLKKTPQEQLINDENEYLNENYKSNEPTSAFTGALPFTPPVLPPFNPRIMPPFPIPQALYGLYGQNLYNFYAQYPQFAQAGSVPGTSQICDPSRSAVNFPGVYRPPEDMYSDMAHLIPPTLAPPVSVTTPVGPNISVPVTKTVPSLQVKEKTRSPPVNVVITSSDPLPMCTTAPPPILSVTIPPEHIKGTPHNYQIPMPSTNDGQIRPPIFTATPTKDISDNAKTFPIWNPSTTFKSAEQNSTMPIVSSAPETTKFPLFTSQKIGGLFTSSVSDNLNTSSAPDISHNKSRTLSEKSNTSLDNYDPCPDFKPIIPLPDEVKVTTGEEDETVVFCARAKLFRFVDKQWKERGIGEMKLLKHNITGKVRVLMRRDQVHKICANHIITAEMEIQPMKNETKAYFWVANDFADETLVLEKFCIRFKTADIANKFYQAFMDAIKNTKFSQDNSIKPKEGNQIKTVVDNKNNISDQSNKTVVGGFTFNTTPTFKSMNDNDKKENKSQELKVNIANPFSNLSFKTANSSLTNIFSSDQSKVMSGDSVVSTDVQSKANTSDTIDEFEPAVDFKPVIPLPPLIDHKTGEENETVIFEQRAKLLRFDVAVKEWKECGLGNIKLLVQKDNIQKVRLLMRREQVLIVCCNHALMPEMNFQKMPNVDKAVTWCAVDSSIGESMPQTFCLRFKTSQICDDFINAVKSAQSKMVCDSKAAKEEQNATKYSNQIGFGDKFKAKPGSWFCNSCYTNNLESFVTCACCKTPKPQNIATPVDKVVVSSWGDRFKPKSGSWECKICLIRNEDTVENCSACSTPKDPTMPKNELKSIFGGNTQLKFSFGIASQVEGAVDTKNDVQTSAGWGDKFKPKSGSWECKQCLIRNDSNAIKCSACGTSKDLTLEKKEQSSIFGNLSSTPKFVFGVPKANETLHEKPKNESSSIFDGSGTHKFTFGAQSMDVSVKSGLNFKFGADNKVPEEKMSDFGVTAITQSADAGLINFSKKKIEESKIQDTTKPTLLPTPQLENVVSPAVPSFVPKEDSSFDFILKSKATSAESPVKSVKNDESIENEYASEDEGNHIHFSPVVPMPDKVEVFTGEENENELYAQRAKLFRFVGHEWKERGIGIVKILKHKETGKLRVVMRREQVLKICLNHALTNEITYVPKDPKTWLFIANDFSETVLTLQKFCLRFQTKEIAGEFKNAIANALEGLKCLDKKDSDDIVFVSEIQATPQEKQRAKELMLPENFFSYKNKNQCPGCRGCTNDDSSVSNSQICTTPPNISSQYKTSSRDSPTNSIYGTPVTLNTTTDSSIFRTPLEIAGQNNQKSLVDNESSVNSTFTVDGKNDKGNISIIKSTLENMSSDLENTSVNSTLASSITQTPTGVRSSILAAPKLNTSGIGKNGENVNFVTVFGTDQIRPPFSSVADNKYVFSSYNITNNSLSNIGSENKTSNNDGGLDKLNLAITKSSENDGSTTEKKIESTSIFTANEPLNAYSGIGQGSIFGTTGNSKTGFVFGSVTGSIFNSNSCNDNKTLNTENPIFGLGTKSWTFSSTNKTEEDETKGNKETVSQQVNEQNSNAQSTNDKKEDILKIDNSLSFAALSNAAPVFIQKKSDFTWDGAGQKIFGSTGRESERDSGMDENGKGDENVSTEKDNDEYDPHYEPIVSLPDVIVVTTGEEDEEKLFWERCKLYRYDENAREWKERGVGEIKILYHPTRKSYRLLLRRELVHKLVLNMLLFADFVLLPMKNSDRAWTWAGRNYAENPSGDQETLAVRFKSLTLAEAFKEKVTECVRKLQANAAQAINDVETLKNNTENATHSIATSMASEPALTKVVQPNVIASAAQVTEGSDVANDSGTLLLRLPKHLADSARVDSTLAQANLDESSKKSQIDRESNNLREVVQGGSKPQVHFQESAVEEKERVEEFVGKEDEANTETSLTHMPEVSEFSNDSGTVLLRLPKHLTDSARVDSTLAQANFAESSKKFQVAQESIDLRQRALDGSAFEIHFQEPATEDEERIEEVVGEEDDYEHNYDYYDEQQESPTFFKCEGEVHIQQNDKETSCDQAHIQLFYCPNWCSPKIMVIDPSTGEILTDMLIDSDSEFQLNDASVSWTGADCTSNDSIEKTVTVTFSDADTATQFYSACEENI